MSVAIHPLTSSLLRLLCYHDVPGGSFNNAFEVKIGREETVAALKKAIKAEKGVAFHDIDADSLILWKVSVSFDSPDKVAASDLIHPNLKETLNAIPFDAADTYNDHGVLPLKPYVKLGKVFVDDPAEEHIHIIVQRPR
jgi:Crinkler effector protein N-terminal domain